MLVAYSSTTDVDFNVALKAAISEFPEVDFSKDTTPWELETTLLSNGNVLYVEVDFNTVAQASLTRATALQSDINQSMLTIDCPTFPPVFHQNDLNNLCVTPSEGITTTPIDTSGATATLQSIQSIHDAASQSVLNCVTEMTNITAVINNLLQQEQDVRNTMVNLQEFLYNYRIMNAFFEARTRELSRIVTTFGALITGIQNTKLQITNITPTWMTDQTTFNNLAATIKSGVYSQQQYTQYLQAQSQYNDINTQYQNLQTQLTTLQNELTAETNSISPFTDPQLTDTNINETLAQQQQYLENTLQGLFSGNSAVQNVASFSTRTTIGAVSFTQPDAAGVPGVSFNLVIFHTIVDAQGVLKSRPKNYANSGDSVTINPIDKSTPHGTLYDALYNIWNDDNKFFTLDQRGLTGNSSMVAAQLKGTGAEVYKGSYIGDATKFQDFYGNYSANWQNQVTTVIHNTIEPALTQVSQPLTTLGIAEVQNLLAFGQVFQLLPNQSASLQDIIHTLTAESTDYTNRVNELQADYIYVQQVHSNIINEINTERQKYEQVSCANNSASQAAESAIKPGTDPLGVTSLLTPKPGTPDITKWCYWTKFALYATALNILPYPEGSSFRYWPIGLLIPLPDGTLQKIPLPIIWVPVAVIPLPVGVFVIFIAECGLCPSPVVFYVGPNGEKKFIVSLRPGDEFGTNAETTAIKTVQNGGIAVMTPIKKLANQVNISGFSPIDSDSKSSIIADFEKNVLDQLDKLGLPDSSGLNSLPSGASIQQKRNQLKTAVSKFIGNLSLPSFNLPKDGSTVNPKPPPVLEIISQLEKLGSLNLPQIALPAVATVNLKNKFLSQATQLTSADVQTPNLPSTTADKLAYVKAVQDALKQYSAATLKAINPTTLGIVALATPSITFINPYDCNPSTSGIKLPTIPSTVSAALAGLNLAANSIISGLTFDQINSITGGATLNAQDFPKFFMSMMAATMPDIVIPDPSNVTISSMMTDASLKVATMQLPSLPDPTAPIQPRISIPGAALKGIMVSSVDAILDGFNISTVDFQMSNVDLKEFIAGIVVGAFSPLNNFLSPFLNIVSKYQPAKDKTFPQLVGMSQVSPDVSQAPVVSGLAMAAALVMLKALSIVPYPAVAVAPDLFKNLHPILSADDLPPWERFTMDNFLFVCFLDQWCRQGKKTSGFFENP